MAGETISLKRVNVYRDLKQTVELDSGLSSGSRVVLNPPSNIRDGQKVKIVQPEGGHGNERVAQDETGKSK